jgi:hypothetical protein
VVSEIECVFELTCKKFRSNKEESMGETALFIVTSDDEAPHAKEDEEKLSPFMFGFVLFLLWRLKSSHANYPWSH